MKKGFQKLFFLGVVLFLSTIPLFADKREDLTAALDMAVYNKDVSAAALLLEAGADPNGISPSDSAEILRLLASYGARFDVTDIHGRSPLMEYISHRYSIEGIIFMLDWEEENSPNFTAGLQSRKDYYTALLTLLLDPVRYKDVEGFSLMERLLNAGADAAHTDTLGNTALHNWVYHQNSTILEMLLSWGCPLDAPNSDGRTPLMNAAIGGYSEAILALLEKGANPNSRDKDGISVLHHYVSNYRRIETTVVAALLAAGARPADMDNEGKSALVTLLFYSLWESDTNPLLDLVLSYSSPGEIEAARNKAADMKAKIERGIFLSEKIGPTIAALSLLIIGYLSIIMREKVYANRKSENWMGPVNGVHLCLPAFSAKVFYG